MSFTSLLHAFRYISRTVFSFMSRWPSIRILRRPRFNREVVSGDLEEQSDSLILGLRSAPEIEERIQYLEDATHVAQVEADLRRRKEKEARKERDAALIEVQELRKKLEETEEYGRRQKREVLRVSSELGKVESNLQYTVQTAKQQQRLLTSIQQKFDDADALLKIRTAELNDARQYLSKTDTISDADVRRLVENLNSETFQTAAQIADSLPFDGDAGPQLAGTNVSVAWLVGPKLEELLRTVKHQGGDATCIQIALQTVIVGFTAGIVAVWDFNSRTDNDSHSHSAESQTVSARWRALTRTHLTNVLLASGLSIPLDALYEELLNAYGEKLRSIIRVSLELRKSIGEEILSSDLETTIAGWDAPYVAEDMVDAYPVDEASAGHTDSRVLCTTELGLRRVEIRTENGKADTHVTVLLKPKIALASLADELQLERIVGLGAR